MDGTNQFIFIEGNNKFGIENSVDKVDTEQTEHIQSEDYVGSSSA